MNLEIKLLLAALLLGGLAGVGWKLYDAGYTAGANAVTVAYAQAMAAAQEKEQDDVKEIIKWREKRVVVYRDKIEEIKVAVDPTGYLDLDLSDVGLGGLLRASSDSPGPGDDDAPGDTPVD